MPIHILRWSRKPLYNLTLNQKNIKFGPLIPNTNTEASIIWNWRLTASSVLRLGILDSALCLTQYSIIKELAAPEDKTGSRSSEIHRAKGKHSALIPTLARLQHKKIAALTEGVRWMLSGTKKTYVDRPAQYYLHTWQYDVMHIILP